MKSEKITFTARNKWEFDIQDRPYPASSAIPQWWKDLTPYEKSSDNPDGKKLIVRNWNSNASAKKCTPMLDALTSGYIIPLWTDVFVSQTEEGPTINWKNKPNVFTPHQPTSRQIPAPLGYDQVVFKYLNTWIPRTPPGYSVLVTSPFGYRDLPFYAIPGIVDSDKATLELVTPVWIKTGLEGVVNHGTPMLQITPFKRTNWESEFDYYEDEEYDKVQERTFLKTIVNHYVKNHWSKKEYK